MSKLTNVLSVMGGAAMLAIAAGQASANTISFNFATTPGSLGTSRTFSATFNPGGPTVDLTATGYKSQKHETKLYYKQKSTVETGLGLEDGPDQEIGKNGFIQLDLTSLLPYLTGSTLTITIGSVQKSSKDAFAIHTSDQAGSWKDNSVVASGNWNTLPANGLATVNVKLGGTPARYLDITETGSSNDCSGSVLLHSFDISTGATPTPEPATIAMLAVGALALALPRRKRKTDAAAN